MNSTSISNRLAILATALAAFASAAGLVVPGLYRDAPFWVEQARGTDLATLFVAVPVLVIALWTSRRGSSTGELAVIGGLLYLVYNYAIFAFSVAMNPLTAIHIAIFGVALWSLVVAGAAVMRDPRLELVTSRLRRRASASLLVGVAAMFGLLWLGQIASATLTGTVPPDLARAGLSTNPVYALDLAFFLPLCAVAGIALVRRNSGAAYALPMLVWVPLMGAGVLGGFVFAALAGDEIPTTVATVIAVLSVASAILAAVAMVAPRSRASVRIHAVQGG
jgi:hypothetical protein